MSDRKHEVTRVVTNAKEDEAAAAVAEPAEKVTLIAESVVERIARLARKAAKAR